MTRGNYISYENIANAGEVIDKIQVAAIKATALLRAIGGRLHEDANDIPLAHETYAHLYGLVDEAVAAYLATRDIAPKGATELEGEATSTLFEVYVMQRGATGAVNVEILARLI